MQTQKKKKVNIKTEARRKLFGQLLISKKLINNDQLQEALAVQRQNGEKLGDILVSLGYVTNELIMQALGEYLGLDVVHIDNIEIPEEVISLIPPALAQLYNVVPISFNKNTRVLTIAQADALAYEIIDDLRVTLKHQIKMVLCHKDEVRRALDKYYPRKHESVAQLLLEFNDNSSATDAVHGNYIDIEELKQLSSTAPVKKWVGLMFMDSVLDKASDIHIEAFDDGYKLRYRIDGILYEKVSPPRDIGVAIISRIKVMAGMDISERRLPQDGRIKLNVGGSPIDLRVSTLPTKFGESIVMRLLDKSAVSHSLDTLGFRQDDMDLLQQILKAPNGIVLVTGPTGSGKTTTLYASLNYLNDVGTKIITTEDPVEYDVDGLIQVQINPLIGVDFASCLRAILRQDPDIILVGEIRDEETAKIAIQASLTGHLVFSTLHTNDAPITVTRLLDIGIEPFMISATLEAVISQRLIRKICPSCKEEYTPSQETLKELKLTDADINGKKFFRGKGCKKCRGVGYKGRMGIYEIMQIDDEIRHLITEKANTNQIRMVAKKNGMKTLRESGLIAIFDGLTTIEEIIRETISV